MIEATQDSSARDPVLTGRLSRLVSRLVVAMVLALLYLVALLVIGPRVNGLTVVRAVSQAALDTGSASVALAAGLLTLTGLLACLATLTPRLTGHGSRLVQGGLVPLLAAIAGLAAWKLGPARGEPAPQDSFILAGMLLVLGFLALVAERMIATIRPVALAEAHGVHALTKLLVASLSLSALGQIALGAGVSWAGWVPLVLRAALAMVALEMVLRPLGRWFLPSTAHAHRRAATDSLIAQLLLGVLDREGLAAPIRAQFGIDFSRSWALRYLRAAILPAAALTGLFCWGLTGLVMIDGDQRGVYQRPGAPVAVLQPGLHLTLPWPISTTHRVEFGTIHEIAIGPEPATAVAAEKSEAEGPPPLSANRLWDQLHPGEVSYVIASDTGTDQNFQTVNADIRLLYRVGLRDADALQAAISVVDPALLVRETARRRLARQFAGLTLAAMLGGQREAMADELRARIAADLSPFESGIEILAVVIEAIHPPAGAAAAYHAVQAAAIGSRTAVADATSEAKGAASETSQESRRIGGAAQAMAAELVGAADIGLIRFKADQAAHEAGGPAFLLERYFADLALALSNVPLTIVDHRLTGPNAPLIDLRPYVGLTTPSGPQPD